MCEAVNESYWLIKPLKASTFSFLVLNLVEKAVLHYDGL